MKRFNIILTVMLALGLVLVSPAAQAAEGKNILIHIKTALSVDDAQICAAPNVALAAVKAGNKVTILIDASAVTSVTKGFGWFHAIFNSETTAMDRAALPERERESVAKQLDIPIETVPHNYGEYLGFLKENGIEIYGNRTMMLLYNIDLLRVASEVTPVDLHKMVSLFANADKVIVY